MGLKDLAGDLVGNLLDEGKKNVKASATRAAVAHAPQKLKPELENSPLRGKGDARSRRAKEVKSFVDYDAKRKKSAPAKKNYADELGKSAGKASFSSKFKEPEREQWSLGKMDQPDQLGEIASMFGQGVKRGAEQSYRGYKGAANYVGHPSEWPGRTYNNVNNMYKRDLVDYDDDGFDANWGNLGDQVMDSLAVLPSGKGSAALKAGASRVRPVNLRPSAPAQASGDVLEHPALAEADDAMSIDDLLDDLGLIPGGVNRQASGLADPRLHTGKAGNFQKIGPRGPRNTWKGNKVQTYISPRNATMKVKVPDPNDQVPVDTYEALFDMNPFM